MLGKLLKHEWKAVWKVPMLLIAILMVMAVVSGLTFVLPIWDSEWVGLPLSGVMLIVMFYLTMIAVSLGITIYMAVRYYKNMFTDEGYLTHTLPVTARQLLLNKTITMTAWNLIGGAAIIVSLFVFFGITMLALMPKDSSFAREFIEGMRALPQIVHSPYMEGINGFCASILCMALVGAFSGTMMVIGSVTLGQMVRKHRILGAVGAYFAITTIVQIVSTMVIMPLMFKMMRSPWESADLSPFPVLTPIYWVMAVISLLIGVGLYFMSEYLVKRQLELE